MILEKPIITTTYNPPQKFFTPNRKEISSGIFEMLQNHSFAIHHIERTYIEDNSQLSTIANSILNKEIRTSNGECSFLKLNIN